MKITKTKTTITVLHSVLIVLLALIFVPAKNVQAQEFEIDPPKFEGFTLWDPENLSSPPEGARIMPILKNESAGFDGVIWSIEANAWIMAEIKAHESTLIEQCNQYIDSLNIWAIHLQESIKTSSKFREYVLQSRLAATEANLNDMIEVNEKLQKEVGFSRREKMIFIFTTVGVGIVAGLAGYTIAKIL